MGKGTEYFLNALYVCLTSMTMCRLFVCVCVFVYEWMLVVVRYCSEFMRKEEEADRGRVVGWLLFHQCRIQEAHTQTQCESAHSCSRLGADLEPSK